ncbi:MAG: hypothetical protein K8T89_04350 [Planctomycetes bacterium]|nr:hypothetical protein [Planctomycetota bacterium]
MIALLKGYRTKIAAVVLALLSLNQAWPVIPDSAVQGLMYLFGGAGLYFLRDALERLKQQLESDGSPK